MAASDRMQYALTRGAVLVFTKHLVERLRTGLADVDGDGEVSSAELARESTWASRQTRRRGKLPPDIPWSNVSN
jgi:hypothetical protein